MRRCLCCGLPAARALCNACVTVFCLPWQSDYVLPAWTSVALTARAVEQRERPYP